MKKISLIAASLAMVAGFSLTSCVQDTEPRIEKPTEFVLNTPTVGDNIVYLSENSTLDLSWSQPNYGLGIAPNYYLQISQYPDFKTVDEEGQDVDAYFEVPTAFTVAKVSLSGRDLALDLQEMMGWENEDAVPTTAMPFYVRVKAEVPNYPDGTIISNAVTLNLVSYFVLTDPDQIWLVGQCEGWNIASAEGWELTETEIGSKIYKGSFNIPAGEFQFRFYDKLGDWEWYSIGSQDEDNPVEISMAGGVYKGACFYDPATEKAGKGSWQDPNWEGGDITITVDLNAMTVEFKSGSTPKCIYLVGAPEGWSIDNADGWELYEAEKGSDVYTAVFDIPADQATFRFYTELGDWDNHSIGSQEPDDDMDVTFPYSGDCVSGKGKWHFTNWTGGEMRITVDLKNMKVDFQPAEQ